MADRTLNAWGQQAEFAPDRLRNEAAIAHAERFQVVFKVIETASQDPTWKAYSRSMQAEAARIADEEVTDLEIEELLVDGVYRRCLGCHARFGGPRLPTDEYRERYGRQPEPADP
jgi:hypothetical protein